MTQLIDLGGGQTVPRNHPPEHLVRAIDMANAAVEAAKANLRQWVRPLYALIAPADRSGTITCTAVGQSARTYTLDTPGATVADVDERDVKVFMKLGFVPADSATAAAIEALLRR